MDQQQVTAETRERATTSAPNSSTLALAIYLERALLRKMAAHGGDFTRPLATAWLAADPDNAGKLRAAFGHYLARYEAAPAVES